jgi:hypothetical protein
MHQLQAGTCAVTVCGPNALTKPAPRDVQHLDSVQSHLHCPGCTSCTSCNVSTSSKASSTVAATTRCYVALLQSELQLSYAQSSCRVDGDVVPVSVKHNGAVPLRLLPRSSERRPAWICCRH